MTRVLPAVLLAVGAFVLSACSGGSGRQPQSTAAAETAFDDASLPSGPQGDAIRYGRELILNTREHLKPYVTANMDCAACHVAAGTKPRAGSFVGIAAQFPQLNGRAHRVIALQDRLAECFLYSMNGHPPAYSSREMVAMVAYITYLSRGTKIGATPDPEVRLANFKPPEKASIARGARIYAQRCSACHAANGAGIGKTYPPLWGATSFNSGAGMHRLSTMAGFVRYNMPQNAPGSLTDQQAYDVSAYVLSHERPHFQRNRLVTFPAVPAGYF